MGFKESKKEEKQADAEVTSGYQPVRGSRKVLDGVATSMGTVMVAVESWGFKVRRVLSEHVSYFMGEQTNLPRTGVGC